MAEEEREGTSYAQRDCLCDDFSMFVSTCEGAHAPEYHVCWCDTCVLLCIVMLLCDRQLIETPARLAKGAESIAYSTAAKLATLLLECGAKDLSHTNCSSSVCCCLDQLCC